MRDIVLVDESSRATEANIKEKRKLVPTETMRFEKGQGRTQRPRPARLLHTGAGFQRLAHWPHLLNTSDPGHKLMWGRKAGTWTSHQER